MYGKPPEFASMNAGVAWLERARGAAGPIYAAILGALETAIGVGELQPGDRLPPQRAVAAQLGVDLTTVTRAYAAARAAGLVEGEVGRGTFVSARPGDDEAGVADLSMNLPPPPEGLSLGELIGETLAAILQRTDAPTLMAYHPGFGTIGQRRAGADWLAPVLGETPPERLLVSPGAQAALAATFQTLCRPGDAVVCEPLTYPGFKAIAAQLGLRAIPGEVDAVGFVPDQLTATCRRERVAALYVVPTLQNPTTRTMPAGRRAALARAAADAGLWIVEDDPYSRLLDVPPPAIATLAPSRTVHVATLAKTLSPGLRIAYVACPDAALADRLAEALRAIALTPAPLMAALATTWIREGRALALLQGVRAEARARRAIAAELLPAALGPPESLHVWLPLASAASAETLRRAAQQRGLALVTHEAFAVGGAAEPGVRISLGGPGRRAALASALGSLAELLGPGAPARRLVV
jgi:DNA-binding transcriptional MocR family regulator